MMMMVMMMLIVQLRDQLICVIRCTERAAVVLNCIRQGLGSNLAGAPTVLTGVCHGFS
jgi:flagellar biosynthesis protein FliP